MCTGSTISHGASSMPRAPEPRFGRRGLVQTLEFQPIPAIRQMLADQGTVIPATGTGSIVYVIAAYNNGDFQTMKIGGVDRQVFGFEWGYQGVCPATQKCGPIASGIVALQRKRLLRRSDRSRAIADLRVALPQRSNTDTIATGDEAHPLGPGLRVHPEHRARPLRGWAYLLRRL